MALKMALTGNEAVALAMKQINPDVVAAYPITPQTDIVQYFSQFVADGEVDTVFVTVESEHSAMSATIGAAAAGARSMTATSSQGLALMFEMLYIAASFRLPIVMPVVNRALSAPVNIHCDHSDTMGARDSGWIQLYSENPQEAYDNTIQALLIAEHADVRLPVMVCQDGFITSHGLENLEVLEAQTVKDLIGEYRCEHSLLDVDRPVTIGALDLQDYYYEHRMQQVHAVTKVQYVVLEVAAKFQEITGRKYGLFETYRLDDADFAVVIMNSAAGTAKVAVDQLRVKGVKAGLLKPRMFRPFPAAEITGALGHLKAVAIMDRAESFANTGGPLYTETRAALFDQGCQIKVANYVYGLGGRDFTLREISKVYDDLARVADGGEFPAAVNHLGVRE
ncbi:MAG: pyruvate ferredoxin oxidoreductase [Bacillota bacterium]